MGNYKVGDLYYYPTSAGKVVKILAEFSYATGSEHTYYKVHYLNKKSKCFVIAHEVAIKKFKPLPVSLISD